MSKRTGHNSMIEDEEIYYPEELSDGITPIGALLRRRRLQMGLTLRAAAERLQMDISDIRKLELGLKRELSARQWAKLQMRYHLRIPRRW